MNVLGLLLTTQAALQHFDPKGGSIINIGSVAAAGIPAAAVYSATKGAVDSITRRARKELGPKKIRVNSLNPGMVETEGVHAAGFIGSDFQKKTEAETPLGRIGQPQDIANVAAFLPPTIPTGSPDRPSRPPAARGSEVVQFRASVRQPLQKGVGSIHAGYSDQLASRRRAIWRLRSTPQR